MNKMNHDSELIAGILANIERVMSGQSQSICKILAADGLRKCGSVR